jgi:hypothetical protein
MNLLFRIETNECDDRKTYIIIIILKRKEKEIVLNSKFSLENTFKNMIFAGFY